MLLHRHAPRKRGIQYAVTSRESKDRLWILDRPVEPGDDFGVGCLKREDRRRLIYRAKKK
jgi:hypothetical protein